MILFKKYDPSRVGLIDEIRGFAIICMVVYHAVYNLVFIFGVDFPFFYSGFMNSVRDVFAAAFIFLSGSACCYSKSNLKRGIICFLFGMLLTLVTFIVIPSQLITFGILHMLGICMMFYPLFKRIFRLPPMLGIIVFFALFFIFYDLPRGRILFFELPGSIYEPNLFFLGLPSQQYVSSDYFPLIPWMFVFAAGTFFGVLLKQKRVPQFFYKTHCRFLAAAGRNTLIIYLLHQPVIYGVMYIVNMAVKG